MAVGNSLSGATWAPAFIAFGANNRSAMVRVPYGRLEFRLPDAGCNPYLVSAAIIAAGLDGIDRQLEIDHVCNENLYSLSLEQIAERGPCRNPSRKPATRWKPTRCSSRYWARRSWVSSSSSSAWSGLSTAAM